MIIASRDKANALLRVDSNLFKNDDRNSIPGETNIEVRSLTHGKKPGTENLSDDQRKIIAEAAHVSGKTIQEIAEEYGVSPDSVAAYKNGATSLATYNEPNVDLDKHIKDVRQTITATAQNKLMLAMQEITGDRLADAKVRDVASIAKDMSSIVKNMGTELTYNDNRKVILYKPRQKEEDEYEVIDVHS